MTRFWNFHLLLQLMRKSVKIRLEKRIFIFIDDCNPYKGVYRWNE